MRERRPGSCSAVSLALEEPLFATASEASAWLLVEQPGPWGHTALVESRLDPDIAGQLERRTRELSIKTLLVKRPHRDSGGKRRCFLCFSGQGPAFLEELVLEEADELLELPLGVLAHGERPGVGAAVEQPLYLVCTNAKRDACCARHGRPLAKALAGRYPGRVWECSHLGGHRFAPNLLSLPDGLCFGRAGVGAAAAYERGEILLSSFRGRSSFPPPAQAADYFVREREGLRGIDALVLEQCDGDAVLLRGADGDRFLVRVQQDEAEPARPISCGEDKLDRPAVWSLVELGRRR